MGGEGLRLPGSGAGGVRRLSHRGPTPLLAIFTHNKGSWIRMVLRRSKLRSKPIGQFLGGGISSSADSPALQSLNAPSDAPGAAQCVCWRPPRAPHRQFDSRGKSHNAVCRRPNPLNIVPKRLIKVRFGGGELSLSGEEHNTVYNPEWAQLWSHLTVGFRSSVSCFQPASQYSSYRQAD